MAPTEVSDEQVAELIERANELFGEKGEGWVKGSYRSYSVHRQRLVYCSVGALSEASTAVPRDQREQATRLARLEIMQTPRFRASKSRPDVVLWNDQRGRKFDDVRNAFVQAARRLRKRAAREQAKQRLAGLR